jgi:hypothetical protein
LGLEQHRAVDHPAVHLDGSGSSFRRGNHTPRPVLFDRSRGQLFPDGGDLARMDAQFGGEAEGAGEIQITLQRFGIIDGRSDALRWTPALRQVAMRESCSYKRLRNRSSQ